MIPGARLVVAAARTTVFFVNVLPMLPSKAINWLTRPPVVERVRYPAPHGQAEGDLYRPSTGGPHPGVVVCLGVVPFGVDHPQVPRLGRALARAGFAALLFWSPTMRDLRLDPEDVDGIALAYRWLIEQPSIDPATSGLIGTCVGGSFALMAAGRPCIRDRVAFVAAFAPYASMWTLAQEIASRTRPGGAGREPWDVDPLTRRVFVRSMTAGLPPEEADRLRQAFLDQTGRLDGRELSEDGQAVSPLLTALDADEAAVALGRLPPAMRARLDAMSPTSYLHDLRAPLVVLAHDRDDPVIPLGESRRLRAALDQRAGVRYTEFTMFKHLDPTKVRLPPLRLAWELGKFYLALYPLFRQAVVP
jgi:dienelactone hydrolase